MEGSRQKEDLNDQEDVFPIMPYPSDPSSSNMPYPSSSNMPYPSLLPNSSFAHDSWNPIMFDPNFPPQPLFQSMLPNSSFAHDSWNHPNFPPQPLFQSMPKHYTTEKNRREQMNNKFEALKLLLPVSTKGDRASIVGDAINYINELQRTVEELKTLMERKRYTRGGRNKRKRAEDGDSTMVDGEAYNGSSSLRSSWLQRKSKNIEVDVRIIDDEVTIKLVQQKRVNCLLFVSKVLDELQLDLHHVAGGLIGDFYSFLFNSKIYEGSSVYASAIANKLIEVVDHYAANPASNCY